MCAGHATAHLYAAQGAAHAQSGPVLLHLARSATRLAHRRKAVT